MYESNTTHVYYVLTVLRQHISILVESPSGHSKKTDPYLEMFKISCWIPNAYILNITMYKMHVSFCSYYTIRIPISKTLTGTYEGGYTHAIEMYCLECWMLLYILLLIAKYVYKL